jgi:hypothetical protein
MERLVRLAVALHRAGKRGVPAANLIEIAGFHGKDATSQLIREFRHLRNLGWQIESVGGQGLEGVYRMTTVDNRLRLALSPEQQAALRRAVVLANREHLAERLGLPEDERPLEVVATIPVGGDEGLATVTYALQRGCLLRFRYNGSERVVHPETVRTQYGKWYLRGREDGSDGVKAFVVSRMTGVSSDPPGSADRVPTTQHPGLHPMSWQIDPPIEVTLRAPADFVPDVRRWLGTPESETPVGDDVDLLYVVTHRAALRSRIYELGPRVSIVGPAEVRDEIVAELAEMAGE